MSQTSTDSNTIESSFVESTVDGYMGKCFSSYDPDLDDAEENSQKTNIVPGTNVLQADQVGHMNVQLYIDNFSYKETIDKDQKGFTRYGVEIRRGSTYHDEQTRGTSAALARQACKSQSIKSDKSTPITSPKTKGKRGSRKSYTEAEPPSIKLKKKGNIQQTESLLGNVQQTESILDNLTCESRQHVSPGGRPAGRTTSLLQQSSSLVVAAWRKTVSLVEVLNPHTKHIGKTAELNIPWKTFERLNFQVLNLNLGEGSTCKVHLVKHVPSYLICVIKVMHSKSLIGGIQTKAYAQHEKSMLYISRKSPFLLKILDVFKENKKDTFYILLEFAPFQTVDHLVMNRKGLGSYYSKYYLYSIARALEFLHGNKMIHRDIKPMNMFILQNGKCVLGDYGLLTMDDPPLKAKCGTYLTRAPEAWNGGRYGFPVDIWAYGASFFNVITNKWPFAAPDKGKQLKELNTAPARLAAHAEFKHLDEDAKRLILKMLEPDQVKRASIREIINSSYFDGFSSETKPPFTPEELFSSLQIPDSEKKDLETMLGWRRSSTVSYIRTRLLPVE